MTDDTDWNVICGDVLDECTDMDDFDAVLCDPPYGLGDAVTGEETVDVLRAWLENRGYDAGGTGFMDEGWDSSVIDPPEWRAIRSAAKEGALMASFGGTRTFDLQSVAQRIAGWEMRDEVLALAWVHAQGAPKGSNNLGRDIDRKIGGGRKKFVEGHGGGDQLIETESPAFGECRICGCSTMTPDGLKCGHPVDDGPATDEGARWDGYGTTLSPAHEPIGLWRNPTTDTFTECAISRQCGAMNVDGCRTPSGHDEQSGERQKGVRKTGRWPTNLVLCHHPECGDDCHEACHVKRLDEQSGRRPSANTSNGEYVDRDSDHETDGMFEGLGEGPSYGDDGGASRFYPRFRYAKKARIAEREAGLFETLDGRDNDHPTVKPVSLCRWLATLLLPPPRESGTRRLLVPFSGSGSEMIGAMLAGWDEVVGVEMNADYCEIARNRLRWWGEHGEGAVEMHRTERDRRAENDEAGQVDLVDDMME